MLECVFPLVRPLNANHVAFWSGARGRRECPDERVFCRIAAPGPLTRLAVFSGVPNECRHDAD